MENIKKLGTIMQLAFVVDDIEAATRYWTETMGVGPFYVLNDSQMGADFLRYGGVTCQAVYDVRIAYWGDMQIELIQQRNEAPSIYTEWRAGDGLHHTCILVDDMDEALGVCAAHGAILLQEGQFGPARFAYVDTGRGPGSILEMLSAPVDVHERYARFRQSAQTWRGEDPVRDWTDA